MEIQRDVTRTFLAVLFIGALIATSLWILRPFLGAVIWAVTIVTATWPLMISVQNRLGGRRSLAVTVMTLLLLCMLLIPLSLAIGTIASNADRIAGWVGSLSTLELSAPPTWLTSLPIFGKKFAAAWEKVAVEGMQAVIQKLTPYSGRAIGWFITEVGSYGVLVLQFLLTVVFAALLYAKGEHMASWMMRFGHRLAGIRGENSVRLAGQAGLAIAKVPFPGILTAVMFMLGIAQIGPVLIMVPAVAWLYWTGSSIWGTFLLLWGLVVCLMDNFLRPILIRKGANLPLLLIFTGVIGGLTAFGLIGIFVGPVVLAVAHTLLTAWVDEELADVSPPLGQKP